MLFSKGSRGGGRDWRFSRWHRGIPYVVLMVSLAVFARAGFYASRVEESQDRARLGMDADQVRSRLRDRLESQVALLRGAAGLFATKPDLTRSEFATYIRRQDLDHTHPGTLGVGYTSFVGAAARVATVEATARREIPDFRIWPVEPGQEVHTILYLEPMVVENQRALGYNMHSNPIRREAMDRARDSGQAAMTGRVTLVQDQGDGEYPAFLIYLPIYRTPEVPETVEERRRLLRGFVYSPFRVHELIGPIMRQSSEDTAYRLYHAGAPDAPLLFEDRDFDEGMSYQVQRAFRVAQTQFSLVGQPRRDAPIPLQGWYLGLSAGISLLLFFLVHLLTSAASRASSAATQLSKSEGRQRVLAQVGQLLNASLDVERTLGAVAEIVVPSFADWCSIDLVEGAGVRRFAVVHRDPQKVAWANQIAEQFEYDPDGPQGVPAVIRTGKAEYYPQIPDEMLVAAARTPEELEVLRQVGFSSVIVAPVIFAGEVAGAITLVYAESNRRYEAADVDIAKEIGRRAGAALENARHYAQVRELNENLERLVRERTHELQAANDELEAFCYSVSHDLRAPLRSVDGFSKAVMEDHGARLPADAIDDLTRVRNAARRMDELITALLVLSRITRSDLHRSWVDVSGTAEQAASDLLRGGHRGEVKVTPNLHAEADSRLLRVVFDNLIGNALKFASKRSDPKVEVGCVRSDNGCAFFVRDNGVGFNEAYTTKLFQPFERLHTPREFPGSGIGLATVQRIVQKHGGRVWAESREGEGATFWFTLS